MDAHRCYLDAARRRESARIEAVRVRRGEARAKLPILVAHLVSRYGCDRVVLVGSLARGTFGAGSDIDLVVTGGIEGRRLFSAGAELAQLAAPFGVDLFPEEDLEPRVRERMMEGAEVLHARAGST